jgi:hypothetical protein
MPDTINATSRIRLPQGWVLTFEPRGPDCDYSLQGFIEGPKGHTASLGAALGWGVAEGKWCEEITVPAAVIAALKPYAEYE